MVVAVGRLVLVLVLMVVLLPCSSSSGRSSVAMTEEGIRRRCC